MLIFIVAITVIVAIVVVFLNHKKEMRGKEKVLTKLVYVSYLIRLLLNFKFQQGSEDDVLEINVESELIELLKLKKKFYYKKFNGIISLEDLYTEYHENNFIILASSLVNNGIHLMTTIHTDDFDRKIIELSVSLINEVLKVKSTNTKSYRHMLETLLMVSKAKLEEDVSKPIIDEMQRLISGIDPNIDEIFSESTSNKDKFQKICHKIAYRRL